jgi:polysaccharide deacetylase 2 family uncharacterized protein YibQ
LAALVYVAVGPDPAVPRVEVPIPPAPPRPAAPPPQASASPPPQAAPARPPAASGPGTADPALLEASPAGPLPIVGPDGRRAWQAYARPFDRADRRARVAMLVTGLGQSAEPTAAAIRLPPGVSLSFSPYAQGLGDWVLQARAAGHEVLLDLPMEPADYPRDDPGPFTLLTSLDAKANRDRLETLLGRATGYVGLVAVKGTRFLGAQNELRPVLDALQRRGLLFVDNGVAPQSASVRIATATGLPIAVAATSVDALDASRAEIDRRLADLEEVARRNGAALGLGGPVPATLERIAAWAAGLADRKLALAPVSVVVRADEKGAAKE